VKAGGVDVPFDSFHAVGRNAGGAGAEIRVTHQTLRDLNWGTMERTEVDNEDENAHGVGSRPGVGNGRTRGSCGPGPGIVRRRGAVVDVVTVYRTIKDPAVDGVRGVLARERIDCGAFNSSSTVRFFCEGLEDGLQPLEGIAVAVIGPVTRRTAEAVGMRVAIEPSEATAAALAEAIAAYFADPDH
jgi:hypothetical protein